MATIGRAAAGSRAILEMGRLIISARRALERALEWLHADLNADVLPKKDVVLEEDAHAGQLQVQYRHEIALDMISDARKRLVLDRRRGKYGNSHV